jgi:hypothetical protein
MSEGINPVEAIVANVDFAQVKEQFMAAFGKVAEFAKGLETKQQVGAGAVALFGIFMFIQNRQAKALERAMAYQTLVNFNDSNRDAQRAMNLGLWK